MLIWFWFDVDVTWCDLTSIECDFDDFYVDNVLIRVFHAFEGLLWVWFQAIGRIQIAISKLDDERLMLLSQPRQQLKKFVEDSRWEL